MVRVQPCQARYRQRRLLLSPFPPPRPHRAALVSIYAPPVRPLPPAQGLEEVLNGMAPGSKRRALIPPELGYVSGAEQPQPPTFATKRQLDNHRRFVSMNHG